MNWISVSEIVAGLVLMDRIDPNSINPADLYKPFDEIIPICRDIDDELERKRQILDRVGLVAWDSATNAARKVNGEFSPLEWVKILEGKASKALASEKLRKVAEKLERGEDVDVSLASQALGMIDFGYRAMTPLSEVEPQKGKFIKTGYEPIDKYIGGLPEASLTVVGASPGIGKTTLMLAVAKAMVSKYPKKKIAFFSLEMTMAQILARLIEIDKDIDMDMRSRMLASEDSYSINDVYAVASRTAAQEDLCLIAVDFADLLVEGEQSESTMGHIYKQLALLAKKTGVPVFLICQLNRTTYVGGIPKINHIRYSGLAEAVGALILLVYNPHTILADYGAETTKLPVVPGKGYVLVGKSRYGFKMGGPGAIQVDWAGETGWANKADGKRWFEILV